MAKIIFSVQFDYLGLATNQSNSCDLFAQKGAFQPQNFHARRFHKNMLNQERYLANFQKNMLKFYQDNYMLKNNSLKKDFNFIKNELFLDKDQTLNDLLEIQQYHILSSHNTYLEDNEYYGLNVSERALVRQLYLGFRCIELDLWPIKQPSTSPYDIYIGIQHKTFLLQSNKMDLISAMQIINKFGFTVDDSPIIITFENNLYKVDEYQYFLQALQKSGAKFLMADNLKNDGAFKYQNLRNTIVVKMHFSTDDRNLEVVPSTNPITNNLQNDLYQQQYIEDPLLDFLSGYSYLTNMTEQIFYFKKEELQSIINSENQSSILIDSIDHQGPILQFYKLPQFQTFADSLNDIESDSFIYYNKNQSLKYVSMATKCYPDVKNIVWFNFEENAIFQNTKKQVEGIKNSSTCKSMTRIYTAFYRNLSDNFNSLGGISLGINLLSLNGQNLDIDAINYLNYFSSRKGYRELQNYTMQNYSKYKIQINQIYAPYQSALYLLQIDIYRADKDYQQKDNIGLHILFFKDGQNMFGTNIYQFEARDVDFLQISIGDKYIYSALIKDLYVSNFNESNQTDYRVGILRVIKNYFWDGSFLKLRILNNIQKNQLYINIF